MNVEDEEIYCDCCGYHSPTLVVRAFERMNKERDGESWNLCDLCAGTMTGTKADYNSNDLITIMQTICFVGNAIREDIVATYESLYNR
jgi:hypothetical protein